jgi:hypothetical protein
MKKTKNEKKKERKKERRKNLGKERISKVGVRGEKESLGNEQEKTSMNFGGGGGRQGWGNKKIRNTNDHSNTKSDKQTSLCNT